jgi:hypothetical protein
MAVTLNASTSSGLVSTADTSGIIELQSNGTTKLTVSSTGAYGQLVSATAQTASGSSVDFTNIPSWVKRITVTINGLSFAAAGQSVLRIGSGSLATSGYTSNSMNFTTTPAISTAAQTNGFGALNTAANGSTINGMVVLVNANSNLWGMSLQTFRTTDNFMSFANGFISLSGTLDLLSLVATTSTFDAGTINILYEG